MGRPYVFGKVQAMTEDPPLSAGFSPDIVDGADLLGLDPQLEPLARLLMDRRTTAPLALALTGEPGTGKSFFAGRLLERAASLQGTPGYRDHVVQIRFSVWQHGDVDLRASLVSCILEQTWAAVGPMAPDGAGDRTVSLARQRLDRLAQLMRRWRSDGDAPEGLQPVDRVLLLVDDLDRCPPAQVVCMLEAIQLLLSSDLFVVVVAADVRWLLRSLVVQHHPLLHAGQDGDGFASSMPRDHLQQIFQLSYAPAPMTPHSFVSYTAQLLSGQNEPSEPPPAHGEDQPAAPTPLTFCDAERQLLVRLQPLIDTPRLTRRLVNIYRLFKSGLAADQHPQFEDPRTGYSRVPFTASPDGGHVAWAGQFGDQSLQVLDDRVGPAFDTVHHWSFDASGAAAWWAQRADTIYRVTAPAQEA